MATIIQFPRRYTVVSAVAFLDMIITALIWGVGISLGLVCIFYGAVIAMKLWHILCG